MVRMTEFESARVSPLTPEISASTGSATSALPSYYTRDLKNVQWFFYVFFNLLCTADSRNTHIPLITAVKANNPIK